MFKSRPSANEIDAMYNDVMTAIDSAIDKIVDSKEVVLTVVSRLLSQASADYQDSVIMNLN